MRGDAKWVGKTLFSIRLPILFTFLVLTFFFLSQAVQVKLDTSLQKMVPLNHDYIKNLFKHKDELSLGNDIRIAVHHNEGTIYDAEYLQILKAITDEVHYLPSIDRSKVKSIWTANVRWVEVTEDGFRGGEVVPPSYDGTPEAIEELQLNVSRSGQIGRLVSDDFRSAIVYVPLLDIDESMGDSLDYQAFSTLLEENVRNKYESEKVSIHIIGFSKKIGDLIHGAEEVALFFAVAIVITFFMLLIDSKCLRSTLIVLLCSLVAVVWQLGILNLLGYGIDPYSMLVPFLVFAIGVSHGVQIINEMAVRYAASGKKRKAARQTFLNLYIPGMLALLSDAIGFVTLHVIDIGVIKELGTAAGIGVAVIILTNLVLVPIFLSFTGVSDAAVEAVLKKQKNPPALWRFLSGFAKPVVAGFSIVFAFAAAVVGMHFSETLEIGDLDPGAPELRANARYNIDDRYIAENYSVSADVLVVLVETPPEKCTSYEALDAMDRFSWHMENTPGVQSVVSTVTVSKLVIAGFNEGNPKWAQLSKIQDILNNSVENIPEGFMNMNCSLSPVVIFLDDHKAKTLSVVVKSVEEFAIDNNEADVAQFVLASGNAGVEAATNQTIEAAQNRMLLLVYGVVSLMCFLTFRSWKAVICIVAPLALTSILCQALMAQLGIGVKVATLPVIALGVGIGVDYGIYIFTRLEGFIAEGKSLQDAYFETLRVTGKAVSFTALTLAIGVGTWVFSDIKFQADMGILLTFMFLWNMVGAIWLLPALANFLLETKQ